MKKHLYTIYDKVAKTCGPVFEAKNDAVAQRAYRNIVVKQGANPDEHQLFRLGKWDDETMELDAETEEIFGGVILQNDNVQELPF